MPRQPLQLVGKNQPVDVLYAEEWNAFIGATKATGGRSQREIFDNPNPLTPLIENASGADLTADFAILGVNAPVFDASDNLEEFQGAWAISGTTPAASSDLGNFVVVPGPMEAGEIRRGIIGGVTPVQIDVPANGTWIEFADVKDADATKLASHASGSAKILWKESGTGTKWGLVRLGEQDEVELDATAAGVISAGGSGLVDIRNHGGYQLTAFLDWVHGGEQLSNAKRCRIRWSIDQRQWNIVAADCE